MTQKICRNIFATLIILMIIATILPSKVFADTDSVIGDLGVGDNLELYKKDPNLGSAQDTIQKVIGLISTIGIAVSVISLMAIGIKYMFAGIEEKVQYRQTFRPYIIGAFMLFTVSIVPQIIFDLLTEFH